jgi:hypothetical protein
VSNGEDSEEVGVASPPKEFMTRRNLGLTKRLHHVWNVIKRNRGDGAIKFQLESDSKMGSRMNLLLNPNGSKLFANYEPREPPEFSMLHRILISGRGKSSLEFVQSLPN